MSGMTLDGPQISVRSMDELTATNTLYVTTFKEFATRFEVALGFLASSVWAQAQALRRRYPDGLLKLEPGELASLRLVPLRMKGSKACYVEAAAAIRAGQAFAVRDEIDALLRAQERRKRRALKQQ